MSIVDGISTSSNSSVWDVGELEASILHGELALFDDWSPSTLVKNEMRVFLGWDLGGHYNL